MTDKIEPIEIKPNYRKYLMILAAVACGSLGVYLGVIDQETATRIIQAAFGL